MILNTERKGKKGLLRRLLNIYPMKFKYLKTFEEVNLSKILKLIRAGKTEDAAQSIQTYLQDKNKETINDQIANLLDDLISTFDNNYGEEEVDSFDKNYIDRSIDDTAEYIVINILGEETDVTKEDVINILNKYRDDMILMIRSKRELDYYDSEIDKSIEQIDVLYDKIAQKEDDTQEMIDDIGTNIEELEDMIYEIKDEIDTLTYEKDGYEDDIESYKSDIDSYKDDIDSLDRDDFSSKKEYEEEKASIEKEINDTKKEIENIKKLIEKINQQIAGYEKRITELEDRISEEEKSNATHRQNLLDDCREYEEKIKDSIEVIEEEKTSLAKYKKLSQSRADELVKSILRNCSDEISKLV